MPTFETLTCSNLQWLVITQRSVILCMSLTVQSLDEFLLVLFCDILNAKLATEAWRLMLSVNNVSIALFLYISC